MQYKKSDVSDNYFGTIVSDPYRWLEDDNAPEVIAWVKEENKKTEDFLSKISFRGELKKRLEEIWDYEKRSGLFKAGNFYYFLERKAYKIKALCAAKAETQRRKALLKSFLIRTS